MHIIKEPLYEDDSYYFILERHDQMAAVKDKKYLKRKRLAFKTRNIDKYMFEDFQDRPSLRELGLNHNLSGTIYTHSAEVKNRMPLEDMFDTISKIKHVSRRCVIRLADSFDDYMDDSINTSCLNIIHYSEDEVKLFFRASDMKNELLYDILLIKEFFIDPVYTRRSPRIHVIASTAQNIIDLKQLLN